MHIGWPSYNEEFSDFKDMQELASQMIRGMAFGSKGKVKRQYRLELQYQGSMDVLEKIAEGDKSYKPQTASSKKIKVAYNQIYRHLDSLLTDESQQEQHLRYYFNYLTSRVKLIRIETKSVAEALVIFETINDRGVGLDAMDLLKNLLFREIDELDFPTLKRKWKGLRDIIDEMQEKPIRFLRYFIFSRYPIDTLRQSQVYKKILDDDLIRSDYTKSPLEFTKKLIEYAKAYRCFTEFRNVQKKYVPYLENITFFAGKSAKQHFILLLAGKHLEPPSFSKLSKAIEALFFVHVITHQQTNALEKKFAQWANHVRGIKGTEEQQNQKLEKFLKKEFDPIKNYLSPRFAEAFERMNEEDTHKDVLRYVLNKLSQFIDAEANQVEENLTTYNSKYEKEHIYPQTPSDEAKDEFGECLEGVAVMLGNLTLLEPPRNRHVKNGPFSKKKPIYRDSSIYLTRTIAEKVKVGDSSITRAVENLDTYDEWNQASVEQRQKMLTNLAHKVWSVVKPTQFLKTEPIASSIPDGNKSREYKSQSNLSKTDLTHIRVFGNPIKVESWSDALIQFLIAMYEHDPKTLHSLIGQEKCQPIMRTTGKKAHKSHRPTKIGDSGLWINAQLSSASVRKKCREIEKLAGHEELSILTFMSGGQPHALQS